MKTDKLLLLGAIATLLTAKVVAENDDPSAWTKMNGFNKRLDHGYLKTPFVDPDNPPAVELIFLSWDGEHLIAGCHFHNLGNQIVKVLGREIVDEAGGGNDFYPYTTLEASNDKKTWTSVGTSPFPLQGREIAIFAPPNPPNQPVVEYRGSFDIHLDAFRPVVGKFEFGRVVLKDGGGSSQVIVLTDLLPPDKPESN
jgi:hypothetical protein